MATERRVPLSDFVSAYTFARRLQILHGLTPDEVIGKAWSAEPSCFQGRARLAVGPVSPHIRCDAVCRAALSRAALDQARMPEDALTEASLHRFLAAFYAKVRRDSLIGPVFARVIPDEDWPRHLAVVQDFWSSVLLKSGRYKGNPFGRHQRIGALDPAHFARWLSLFEQTAKEMFAAEVATLLAERAHRIGDSLKAGLFFRPDGGPREADTDRPPPP